LSSYWILSFLISHDKLVGNLLTLMRAIYSTHLSL
jgi:hypothetical protein